MDNVISYPKIQALPKNLANQIAAGEVIERPASILKELIENSIDAGSNKIDILIENGGMGLIRIQDNGCGISKQDLKLALARHATSKIHVTNDLFAISTLGFRGEALASISSVAKIRILSKPQNQKQAYSITYSDNEHDSKVVPCSQINGTTTEVRDLFYNVPVRRKFLKSEKTEWQHIIDTFKKFVLSHPHIAFSIKHNGKKVKTLPKAQDKKAIAHRLNQICGPCFLQNSIQFKVTYDDMELQGWVGQKEAARRQIDGQYFFLNSRPIRDKLISHAVKTAYENCSHLEPGVYPSYVLYLKIPLEKIDINVHPTKHEVRFVEPSLVHDFLQKAISEALKNYENPPTLAGVSKPTNSIPLLMPAKSEREQFNLESSQSITINNSTEYHFIVTEDEIYIIDNKAALPIVVERYLQEYPAPIKCIPLLFPISFEPSGYDFQYLFELGFKYNERKDRLFITHIPFYLDTYFLSDGELIRGLRTKSGIKKTLLKHLSPNTLSHIDSTWLHNFYRTWIKANQDGPWVNISKTEIQNKISDETYERVN